MTLATLQAAGRDVAYAEWGDPAGYPVVVLHGTPGSRLGRWSDNDALAATGMRQIGINRPGYGPSTRLEGRTVSFVATDVLAVADALGLDRFAVVGTSGGGPHALAVAALNPDRVSRCRVTSCLAPAGIPGFFDGMDPHNVEEWELALRGEALSEVTRRVELMRKRVLDDPASVFADLQLPASDRVALTEQAAFTIRRESLLEALATPFGWYDDDMAFAQPWGFEVSSVEVPLEIRYGRHDVFVPPSHGDWLAAALPHAEVVFWPNTGHLREETILADYRALVMACYG
ncbi:MAG: alpha/beta hydrolase [Actinomycetota bacterium]|nr:alpha/beta hydrolase [Actinomycetota bacterium]